MHQDRKLVLDANILLRAILGVRVLQLIKTYRDHVGLYAPSACFLETRRHIPRIAMLRNLNPVALLSSLDRVEAMVEPVEEPFYLDYKRSALARLPRDPEDWPIAASALLLNCPIWTEDLDFFGCGIPTWTTANIEIYLREP